MANAKKPDAMGATECARRTGLTVRALRLYERHGLIKPRRAGQGWRCYGAEELRRLNVIVTLKSVGMTLAQIRTLLEKNPPPLEQVLQLQLQACIARREAAAKAASLVKTALTTMESGKQLSLEDLCSLTRSMEMESEHVYAQFVREVINEKLTPEEERAAMTWLAGRPPAEMRALREAAAAARPLINSFKELWEKKVDPAAPEVQALVAQHNEIAVRYGARQHTAAMHEWNAPVAQKWMLMAERLMPSVGTSQAASPDAGLAAYMRAATKVSPWSLALEPIVDEAAALLEKASPPSSQAAQALVARLRQICADHSLGDPLVHARFTRAMQFREPREDCARKQAAWALLVSAFEAAAPDHA